MRKECLEKLTRHMDKNEIFCKYVHQRIRQNKHFVAVIVGESGSGKTYSSLKIAEMLDPNFSAERIAFTARDFMKLVHAEMPKGSVIIWDESGVGLSAKDWQSRTNKLLGFVFQTMRFKNYIIIMTLPNFNFLDKSARKMTQCIIEMENIIKDKQLTICKPKMVTLRQHDDLIYYKFVRYVENGVKGQIRFLELPMASKQIRQDYEKAKKSFVDNLYSNIMGELGEVIGDGEISEKKEGAEAEVNKVNVIDMRKVDEIIEMRVKELRNTGLNNREIAKATGVSAQKIGLVVKKLIAQNLVGFELSNR